MPLSIQEKNIFSSLILKNVFSELGIFFIKDNKNFIH